jgi:pimeloyl-ACP methyl ester carboxylesterase
MRLAGFLLILWHAFGCTTGPVNPSFSVSRDEARKILDRVGQNPKRLDRPLVIVGGFGDPGVGPALERAMLCDCIDDRRVLSVVVAFEQNFDDCRETLIHQVERRFPGEQVDVIGLSMGGLVARYAAAPVPRKSRLNIARLFTVSSPHTGALMARLPTLDRKVVDMRPGSDFLARLAAYDTRQRYELIPYVRLRDELVGELYAAPAGTVPWWIDTPGFEPAHIGAGTDPRILADIVLRLRDDAPLTHNPPAPLPTRASAKS